VPTGGDTTSGAREALTIEDASPAVEDAPYQLPVEADPTLPQPADDANPLLLGSPVPGATGSDPDIAGDPQATMGPEIAEQRGTDTSAAEKDAAPDPLLVPAAGLAILGTGLVLLRAGARRLA
jgi:hypothetical protein